MKQPFNSPNLPGGNIISEVNQTLQKTFEEAKKLALRVYNNQSAQVEEEKGPSVEDQIKSMREEVLAEVAKQLTCAKQNLRAVEIVREKIKFSLTLDEETKRIFHPYISHVHDTGYHLPKLGIDVRPENLSQLLQNPNFGSFEILAISIILALDKIEQVITTLLENQSKLIGVEELRFTQALLRQSDVKHLRKLTELPQKLPLRRISIKGKISDSMALALKDKLSQRFSLALFNTYGGPGWI